MSGPAVVAARGSDFAYVVQGHIDYGVIIQARRGPAGELSH
jgi:hypothetical protein